MVELPRGTMGFLANFIYLFLVGEGEGVEFSPLKPFVLLSGYIQENIFQEQRNTFS